MKKIMCLFGTILTLLTLILPTMAQQEIQRGTPVPIECGESIDSEFTNNAEEQTFSINLSAGDRLDVSVVPLGQLNTFILVNGPTNLGIAVSNGRMNENEVRVITLEPQPKITTGILGASGAYTIRIVNTNFVNSGGYTFAQDRYGMGYRPGGIGAYTLYIGCTLRNGTVIEPGDSVQESPPITTTFSGMGFPGLAPVDFSNVSTLPLEIGSGTITPNNSEIVAFVFEASAGDIFQLDLQRRAGNLNLGLVVMSADNTVVSYGGLITGDTFSTRLTLPSAGQYTIGVFRIDLLPPSDPQATAFQVTGTINP